MTDIHQPHDRPLPGRLFRCFGSRRPAADGVARHRPEQLRPDDPDLARWQLRRRRPAREPVRLLYQVEHAATGQPVSMYLLSEHQSSPDPWMRLRLLRCGCRIREADRRDDPDRRERRPIVPVVFYQGARDRNHSTEFSDLFPEAARALPWVPRFAHELLDQTTLGPDEVGGGVRGRHVDMALQMTAQLVLSPSQARGGVDETPPLRPVPDGNAGTPGDRDIWGGAAAPGDLSKELRS